MAADAPTPPKYNCEIVGQAILLAVIEHHPTLQTVDQLRLEIVSDPEDRREVEVANAALRDLRRACLVRYWSDDPLVEPTQAALRAHALLSRL